MRCLPLAQVETNVHSAMSYDMMFLSEVRIIIYYIIIHT